MRLAIVLVGLIWASPIVAGLESLFDSTSKDFGSVPHGSVQIHRFLLTNTTGTPIRVASFYSSCKCATPSIPVKTADPGQTLAIDVEYNTRTFTGPRSMTITVNFDQPTYETVHLRVSGYSRQDVVYNPSQVSFGVVSKGATPENQIKIEYAGPLEWKIEDVANADGLDVAFEELYRQPRKAGYTVKVKLPDTLDPGPIFKSVQLKTNDPQMPLLSIPVTGTIEAMLAATPDHLTLGEVKMGEKLTKRIILKGKSPFSLEKVTGQVDGVLVKSTDGLRTAHVVEIEYSPTQLGKVEQEILFTTSLDKTQPLAFRLSAEVREK